METRAYVFYSDIQASWGVIVRTETGRVVAYKLHPSKQAALADVAERQRASRVVRILDGVGKPPLDNVRR